MKIQKYPTREEWLQARRGKITGTRLQNLIVKRGNKPKIGFYELIAERLAVTDDEHPMDRGVRLEDEALGRFEKQTKKQIIRDLVIWSRKDNENVAISPDAYSKDKTEAVEVKCLSSARHIEAYLTQDPGEHKDQALQYFIVNDKLKTLYLCYYDPRMPSKDFFFLTINRADLKEEISWNLAEQRRILEEVEKIVVSLTF